MYYLGIDGGGTKTRYVLINDELSTACDIERGTIHIHQIGKENMEKELNESLNIILEKANVSKKEINYIFIGAPGYGESKNDKDDIDEVMNNVFGFTSFKVANDAVAGWAAGTGCKNGINIVAGTGSIAYGRNENGEDGRVGGWGPGIGDDGSAYSIGLKVINEYTKQKDGRHKTTILVDILETEMNIEDYFEIVDIVFNRLKFSRTELAKFSKIAFIAASKGCVASREIFRESAYEIFLHIKALKTLLNFENEFILSYTGGVFKSGDFILEPLKEMLNTYGVNCIIKEPEIEPWNGAALMAYTLYGNVAPVDYKERFK
ncbi:MAG: BadF/BadG/BcrA/BcrD ATPase family protein [Clostridium sp.]|uniref:BadF/BadG/BcrA/BcrD ATPase family protein n=1 Tax=Clostridium sp. TaxID=1506 RepID=UPI003F366FD6